MRIAAVRAAAALGPVAVNNLSRSTSPEKPEIRRAIVATLHEIGERPLSEYFDGRLREDLAALEGELTMLPFVNLTLTHGADRRILPVLHRGLQDSAAAIRASAVLQLARIGDLTSATHALADPEEEPEVRTSAAEAIGWYWTGDPGPIAALQEAAAGDDPAVAKAARSAMRRLHLRKLPTPAPRRAPAIATAEVDPRFAWSELLHRWSLELCADEDFVLTQDDAVIESGWTGRDPVGLDELAALERRVGRTLPPSYRSFLLTTDGYVGGGQAGRIRPAREVKPFVDDEGEWVDIWLATAGGEAPLTVEEHLATRGGDPAVARWPLLADTIQISDTSDGAVYLLCPAVVDEDGDWEAWFFASWLTGARRYASWWELVADEHRTWQVD